MIHFLLTIGYYYTSNFEYSLSKPGSDFSLCSLIKSLYPFVIADSILISITGTSFLLIILLTMLRASAVYSAVPTTIRASHLSFT